METKPIKRNKHLIQLSKDHHFTLLFSWKIRQGLMNDVDAVRLKNYVQFFWLNDMQQHFRDEEVILFAPLNDDKVRKALEDHKQIKGLVDTILSEADSSKILKQLPLLADMVDNHVRFEERELFPHLERNLTEEQLEKIGAELKKEPVLQNYEDEFWLKKN